MRPKTVCDSFTVHFWHKDKLIRFEFKKSHSHTHHHSTIAIIIIIISSSSSSSSSNASVLVSVVKKAICRWSLVILETTCIVRKLMQNRQLLMVPISFSWTWVGLGERDCCGVARRGWCQRARRCVKCLFTCFVPWGAV